MLIFSQLISLGILAQGNKVYFRTNEYPLQNIPYLQNEGNNFQNSPFNNYSEPKISAVNKNEFDKFNDIGTAFSMVNHHIELLNSSEKVIPHKNRIKKNALKADLPAFFRNTLSMSYERKLNEVIGIETGYGKFNDVEKAEINYSNSGQFFRVGVKYLMLDFPNDCEFTGLYIRTDLLYLNQQINHSYQPEYIQDMQIDNTIYSVYRTKHLEMNFRSTALIANMGYERVYKHFFLFDIYCGLGMKLNSQYSNRVNYETSYRNKQSVDWNQYLLSLANINNPGHAHLDVHGASFNEFEKPILCMQVGFKVGVVF
jgi:hypothetical protein